MGETSVRIKPAQGKRVPSPTEEPDAGSLEKPRLPLGPELVWNAKEGRGVPRPRKNQGTLPAPFLFK